MGASGGRGTGGAYVRHQGNHSYVGGTQARALAPEPGDRGLDVPRLRLIHSRSHRDPPWILRPV